MLLSHLFLFLLHRNWFFFSSEKVKETLQPNLSSPNYSTWQGGCSSPVHVQFFSWSFKCTYQSRRCTEDASSQDTLLMCYISLNVVYHFRLLITYSSYRACWRYFCFPRPWYKCVTFLLRLSCAIFCYETNVAGCAGTGVQTSALFKGVWCKQMFPICRNVMWQSWPHLCQPRIRSSTP